MTHLDQLVFGYRDGHQLLAGSREIASRDLRLLLGATDMSLGGAAMDRFITGVPLATGHDYAVCATWAAPEAPRPGAVWAHVLLVPVTLLAELHDPFAVTSLLARPNLDGLDRYGAPLPLPTVMRPPGPPPEDVLRRVVAAAYGPASQSVLVVPDPTLAEPAIAAIWGAQWPELRSAFSFRTRPTARADKVAADLVVTSQVRGTTRPSAKASSARWVALIAGAISSPEDSTFHSFLHEFGPLEPPAGRTVRALADVYLQLEAGSVDQVRATLEKRYPTPTTGSALKLALFGPGSGRPWAGSEMERVRSVLATTVDAWDLGALALEERILALAHVHGPSALLSSISDPSVPAATAALDVLAPTVRAQDIREMGERPDLLADVLHRRVELLEEDATWVGLSAEAIQVLLTGRSLSASTIVAAVRAGVARQCVAVLGWSTVARAVAHAGGAAEARMLLDRVDPVDLPPPDDDRVALMLAGLSGGSQFDLDLLERLERQREHPDEIWLRAAVEALGSGRLPQTPLLLAVFGPLHEAITSDRLPRECWARLDPVLPLAQDPALRLRRLLLSVAAEEGWTSDLFRKALRGAGPHADQLVNDVGRSDDWWVAATRAVIRAALGVVGNLR